MTWNVVVERLGMFVLVSAVGAHFFYWLFIGRHVRTSELEEIGTLYNYEVTVVLDVDGRRMVGLNVYRTDDPALRGFLTTIEARTLAAWLRQAAARPGTRRAVGRRSIGNPA
ncbi:MAG TPA: hypothetical protein VM051_03950 [Usitatibacter sp.]|nr:hypothetical protein [Usitatibacter sp.]